MASAYTTGAHARTGARRAARAAVAFVVACVIIALGPTEAHAALFGEDERTSTVSVSNVSVELVGAASGLDPLAPGTHEQRVTVSNTGTGPCFVRAALELSNSLAERFATPVVNVAAWSEKRDDGFYYLPHPLFVGESSEPLLTALDIADEPADGYFDFDVLVVVEAVQAKDPDTGELYPDCESAFRPFLIRGSAS